MTPSNDAVAIWRLLASCLIRNSEYASSNRFRYNKDETICYTKSNTFGLSALGLSSIPAQFLLRLNNPASGQLPHTGRYPPSHIRFTQADQHAATTAAQHISLRTTVAPSAPRRLLAVVFTLGRTRACCRRRRRRVAAIRTKLAESGGDTSSSACHTASSVHVHVMWSQHLARTHDLRTKNRKQRAPESESSGRNQSIRVQHPHTHASHHENHPLDTTTTRRQ